MVYYLYNSFYHVLSNETLDRDSSLMHKKQKRQKRKDLSHGALVCPSIRTTWNSAFGSLSLFLYSIASVDDPKTLHLQTISVFVDAATSPRQSLLKLAVKLVQPIQNLTLLLLIKLFLTLAVEASQPTQQSNTLHNIKIKTTRT